MQRERITEDIYVFTSDLYAQVTAGLIMTEDGAILIDTLAYPEETMAIRQFVEDRLKSQVRYVVNTHYHADHTTGTCFFPEAHVISHRICRDLLNDKGRESLEGMKSTTPGMDNIELVLPDMVFEKSFLLHLGGKSVELKHAPGHSPDSIVCHVQEDNVLFAADTQMPIPYFVDGNHHELSNSIECLCQHPYDSIIQGHGEVILRGEVEDKLRDDLNYLVQLRTKVEEMIEEQRPPESIKIEACGKSRVLLNGMAEQLHHRNVVYLADAVRNGLQTEQ